jgi:hypothetical protein
MLKGKTMKSQIEKLLKDVIAMDIQNELDTFGHIDTVRLALAEWERVKGVVLAAREVRAAQEAYYRGGRTNTAMVAAKRWERELDKRLSELWHVETEKQEPLL